MVLALSCGPGLAASNELMVFRALTLDDGLSQNTVNDSLQDDQGYMWFATENGLNRYDGYKLKTYMRDPSNPDALASDFIWALVKDRHDDLWLATEGAGLVHWDRDRDVFRSVLDFTQPARRLARSVFIDGRGHIWLGTRGAGLIELDAQGRELRSFTHQPDNAGSLSHDTVSALTEDATGALLIATDQGVDRLDPSSGHIARLVTRDDLPPGATVSSLLRDSQDVLWIGTYEHGLFARTATGLSHYAAATHRLSSEKIRDLLQDQNDRLWVATQDGLNLWHADTATFSTYRHKDADRYSLSDNHLMSLSQDRDGVLWVGTRFGGVNRWNPRSWALGARAPEALSDAVVLAFADSHDGHTWIGGFGVPLQKFARDGTLLQRFEAASGFPDRGEAPVTALLSSRDQRLWIGTMGAGLQIYDPQTGTLRSLLHDPDDPGSLAANGIMCLFQDREGDIWAGTFGGGLNRIDPVSLEVLRYPYSATDPQALGSPRATSITQSPSGDLWIGTDGGGLSRLDRESGRFVRFSHVPDRPGSLGSDTVYALYAAPDGDLWVGTAGAGLARLRGAQEAQSDASFQRFTTADGMSSNVINGIRPDAAGKLWLSSNRGIIRFDPATLRKSSFHRVHGLQSEEFNFGAHHRSQDGRLFFGGTGGFNAFDPSAVQTSQRAATLVLTRFEKFNQPVKLPALLGAQDELVLHHDDAVITFEYAALDYTAPEQHEYSVRLRGFDRDWSAPSTRHRSTYTNLDAGHYVFEVRVANREGDWNPQILALPLRVKPAPWASPLAYFIYAVTLAGLLYGFFRWRLDALARKARMEQLAFYDRVTGLPNRELFEIRANAAIEEAQSGDELVAVVCLRVGPFKQLHDSFGYRSIDDVLRTLGLRLSQNFFGDGETSQRRDLARLGEDTFVAFIRVGNLESDLAYWVRRLTEAVSKPVNFGEHRISIPCYAGISSCPQDGADAISLIKFAQTAANDAWRSKSTGMTYYDKSLTMRAMDRLKLESRLRQAIEQDVLDLHLQAKFTNDGRLVGAEALSRWTDPERGMISPGVFVPLAEESDLIMDLDEWVIGRACKALQHWQDEGYSPLSIAVNVSAETFVSGRIFAALERNRERYTIDPAKLEIEITESVLASDLAVITDTLKRIKALGHSLSLDDFGTGYSSLTYLQRFPIDKLKIDQAFVIDMENKPDQRALCTAVISLARGLGLKTIAEGVENQAQLDLLTELGCDQLQGFFLHRPQAISGFEEQLLQPLRNAQAPLSVPRNS